MMRPQPGRGGQGDEHHLAAGREVDGEGTRSRFRRRAFERRRLARDVGPLVEAGRLDLLARVRPGSLTRTVRSLLGSRPRSRPGGSRRPVIPVYRQRQTSDCGPACLAMALAYHGIEADVATLRDETNAGRDGVSARTMLDVARRYGLSGRGVRTTIDGLRSLPPATILFWDFRHFVVLERTTRDSVQVVDPAFGRRRITWQAASDAFTGVAIEIHAPMRGRGDAPTRRSRRGRSDWRYLGYFFPRSRSWIPVVAASLALLLFNPLLPLATAYAVDHMRPGSSIGALPQLVLGLLVMLGGFLLLQLCRSLSVLAVQTIADFRVTYGVLQHLLSLPYGFFASRSPGDLALRVRTSTTVRQTLTNAVVSSLFDGCLVLVYLLLVLFADTFLGLVVVVLAGVQVGMLVTAWKRQEHLAADALESQAHAQGELAELIEGVLTLKAAGLDRIAAERWSHTLAEEVNARARSRRNLAMWSGLSTTLQFGAPLIVLLVGSLRVTSGTASLGEVLGFTALAGGVFVPLANLVQAGLYASNLGATLTRLADILEAEPEASPPRGQAPRRTVAPSGAVRLEQVSFCYPGGSGLVLERIDAAIAPGEFAAVLGPSGCGKSTLAMILAGLYLPVQGRVLVDGVDTSRVDRAALRRSIAFVNQDARLFAGSIRDNIAWGGAHVSDDEVVEAARLAEIHDTVLALPMGYETLLQPGGGGLSGGQRQRVALARALVRRPKLLILDEATSALDAALEERIFARLLGLDCTLVVIAHRLAAVASADQVLTLDGGRVVRRDTGTRQEADAASMARTHRTMAGVRGAGRPAGGLREGPG